MSGTWSKLKKLFWFKSSGASKDPPSVLKRSDSGSNMPRYHSSGDSSASLSSGFSRSLTSNARSSKKTCAICLGNLKSGHGHAIFTAECSHTFHFSCIADSVKHGNLLCPICRFKWKEIPLQMSNGNVFGRAQVSPYQALPTPPPPEPSQFFDDEPLPIVPEDSTPPVSLPPPLNNLIVETFTEFPAVAAMESVSDFAVLVGVHAPPLLDDARQVDRAPVDLVTVLDVSGSMSGSKLNLLKHAVDFVIDNLGPADRLSIVAFSTTARRIFRLRRMTETGREDARRAVSALSADGGTNIVQGLKKGARVLEDRREKNPVASIILLSDGKDTFSMNNDMNSGNGLEYLDLLPASIRIESRKDGPSPLFPVHTFGFGSDHDSSTMHAISDASGGTFSFIESIETVQDAFARCIGGLLSVVAQELRLTLTSASPGVVIGSIPSGKYTSGISEQGVLGTINIGDMYADEKKKFLVYLSVPIADQGSERTSLLKISCSYTDTASKDVVQFEDEGVNISRPKILSPADGVVSLEVDLQKNRLFVAAGIAEAKEMAEKGDFQGAQAVLANTRSVLLSSASAQAGDGLCSMLESELNETRDRMMNMEMYEQTGRAYVLSGMSSHSWQRATTRGDSTTQTMVMREGGSSSHAVSQGYDTPSMVKMVSKSQDLAALNRPRQANRRQNKSTSLAGM